MKKNPIKVIKRGSLNLALAVALILAGLGIAYLGNTQKNALIIGLGFFMALGGFLLLLHMRETVTARILPGRKKLPKPANAFVIYPDEVEFDYIPKPSGHQLRCITDGKWYNVLIGRKRKDLKEFRLPDDEEDARHYDPREFANPVTMPANKRLFEPMPSIIKTIAVGIMGVAVCILAIVIIAMSG